MRIAFVISGLIFICLLVASAQNSALVQFRILWWETNASVSALLFYASVAGAAIVGILCIPRLTKKHLEARRLAKRIVQIESEIDMLRDQQKSA